MTRSGAVGKIGAAIGVAAVGAAALPVPANAATSFDTGCVTWHNSGGHQGNLQKKGYYSGLSGGHYQWHGTSDSYAGNSIPLNTCGYDDDYSVRSYLRMDAYVGTVLSAQKCVNDKSSISNTGNIHMIRSCVDTNDQGWTSMKFQGQAVMWVSGTPYESGAPWYEATRT